MIGKRARDVLRDRLAGVTELTGTFEEGQVGWVVVGPLRGLDVEAPFDTVAWESRSVSRQASGVVPKGSQRGDDSHVHTFLPFFP